MMMALSTAHRGIVPAANRPFGTRVLMGTKVGFSLAVFTGLFVRVLILISGVQAFRAKYKNMRGRPGVWIWSAYGAGEAMRSVAIRYVASDVQ
jgi:hypothetical protein